ncbi:MAG: hypothetical protein FWD68_17125 [Alphaproteobacteria bacterium]|nr:hypothetical protein [Alphaproteobacteria bacterium]
MAATSEKLGGDDQVHPLLDQVNPLLDQVGTLLDQGSRKPDLLTGAESERKENIVQF